MDLPKKTTPAKIMPQSILKLYSNGFMIYFLVHCKVIISISTELVDPPSRIGNIPSIRKTTKIGV